MGDVLMLNGTQYSPLAQYNREPYTAIEVLVDKTFTLDYYKLSRVIHGRKKLKGRVCEWYDEDDNHWTHGSLWIGFITDHIGNNPVTTFSCSLSFIDL